MYFLTPPCFPSGDKPRVIPAPFYPERDFSLPQPLEFYTHGECTNPMRLVVIGNILSSTNSTDLQVATICEDAYRGNYQFVLNEIINGEVAKHGEGVVVINDNVKRMLSAPDKRIELVQRADGTVTMHSDIGIVKSDERQRVIEGTLKKMPVDITNIISKFDDQLEIAEKNEDEIIEILKSNDPSAKSLIFSAASEQGNIENLNKILDKIRKSSSGPPDLSNVDLSSLKLAGIQLFDVILNGANLQDTDLSGAKLIGAKMIGANLTGAILVKANLAAANLTKASLIGANLDNAFLPGAQFVDANLKLATLRGLITRGEVVDFTRARLDHANLNRAHLEGAVMKGARLDHAKLVDTHLEGAILHDAHFDYAKMNFTRLDGAELVRAKLPHAQLTFANLSKADLTEADFSNATLNYVKLINQPKMIRTIWHSVKFESIETDDATKKTLPSKIQKKCVPSTPVKFEKG